ncbi:uncharacterized protein JN550_000092 [Neoarthrinium moseri]|uniref:uncharacterized protein n=1 Tax=Neoarthrinium moseri TaxID=1658444 RepID=UPI001FDC1797|nr:uncharacterized protein JN550_000092 [Neoarthrinium moseri]KAI1877910.1 hypothetical protein JN550_000092 [Neoarthrinium moseri]
MVGTLAQTDLLWRIPPCDEYDTKAHNILCNTTALYYFRVLRWCDRIRRHREACRTRGLKEVRRLPIYGLPVTNFSIEEDDSNVTIEWSHFNNVRSVDTGNYHRYYWLGPDPTWPNRRLGIRFSSRADAEDFRTSLSSNSYPPPDCIHLSDAHYLVPTRIGNQVLRNLSRLPDIRMIDREELDEYEANPDEEPEFVSCFTSVRDQQELNVGAQARGIPMPEMHTLYLVRKSLTRKIPKLISKPLGLVFEKDLKVRISGLESVAYEATERLNGPPEEKTARKIRKRRCFDHDLDMSIPPGALTSVDDGSRLLIIDDGDRAKADGAAGILNFLKWLTGWQVRLLCHVSGIQCFMKRLLLIWEDSERGERWVTMHPDKANSGSKRWMHGKLWPVPVRSSDSHELTCDFTVSHFWKCEGLDIAHFADERHSSSSRASSRETSSSTQEEDNSEYMKFRIKFCGVDDIYQCLAYAGFIAALLWLQAFRNQRRDRARAQYREPEKAIPRRNDPQAFQDKSDTPVTGEILHKTWPLKQQSTLELEKGLLIHGEKEEPQNPASEAKGGRLPHDIENDPPTSGIEPQNTEQRCAVDPNSAAAEKLPPVSVTLRLRNLPASMTKLELGKVLAQLWPVEDHGNTAEASSRLLRVSLIPSVEAKGLAHRQTATVCLAQPRPRLEAHLKKVVGFLEGEVQIRHAGHNHEIFVDDHFHGLTPLYSRGNRHIDIVAVTGWHGRAFWSWKPADAGHMWLRDWLGPDLSNQNCLARVYTYGYPSQVAASDSDASVRDYGQTLLHHLVAARSGDIKAGHSTPLVFIGHSLGGLVIKQALKDAAQSVKPAEKDVAQSLLGCIMFGVPNLGMHNGSLLPMTEGRPNETFARTLGVESHYLPVLDEDFSIQFTQQKVPMIAIYETLDSPSVIKKGLKWSRTGPKVRSVSRTSACSRSTEQVPSHTDHSDLAKFKNPYSEVYQTVVARIIEFSQRRVRNSISHIGVPSSLDRHFLGRDSVLAEIEDCLVSAEGPQVFVLVGTGGMGKTQIALKHISMRSDMYSRVLWIRSDTEQNLKESFEGFAVALGLSHDNDCTQAVLRHLASTGQKFLLVYDNLDDAALVRTIGDSHRNLWLADCRVMITTRNREYLTFQTEHCNLEPLQRSDAYTLLGRLLAGGRTNPYGKSSALEDICTALGNLPLGIQQAAAYLNYSEMDPSTYLNQLRRDPGLTLKYVGRWWPYKLTLLEAWETSLAQVCQQTYASKWFSLCSLLDKQIPTRIFDLSRRRLSRDPGALDDDLRQQIDWLYSVPEFKSWSADCLRNHLLPLTGLSLVKAREQDGGTLFDLYPLIREWARLRLAPAEKRHYLIQAAVLLQYCLEELAYDVQSEQDQSTAFLNQRWLLPHVHSCIEFSTRYLGIDIAKVIPLQSSAAFAMLLIHESKYALAQSMLEKALPSVPLYQPRELVARRVLALALRRQDKLEDALKIQQVVVQEMTSNSTLPQSQLEDVLLAEEELATIYRDLKRYDIACAIQIGVVQRSDSHFGANHLRSLHGQACLATILSRTRRYVEAADIESRILEVYETMYPDRPEIFTKKRNLAVSYYNLDRFDDAVELECDVLNGIRDLYGDDHLETAAAMHNLGATYFELGHMREAKSHLSNALSIRRITLGESHRRTLKTAELLKRAETHDVAHHLPKELRSLQRDSGIG